MEPHELSQIIRTDKRLSVLHHHLTVTTSGKEASITSGTCAVACSFYNSKVTIITVPYKPISRIIKVNE